jgi:hypothetical protein
MGQLFTSPGSLEKKREPAQLGIKLLIISDTHGYMTYTAVIDIDVSGGG